MEIKKSAVAGTMESSDAQITVEPLAGELKLSIESSVMNQYGRQIKECAYKTLNELGIKAGNVRIVDKGALECTLKARIECAVYRSNNASESNIAWGGAVR
jgi:citrate lyase subunit gamma (acyl carrier protein)